VPRKILLADDSVTAQNMGKKILSDAGYEVVTVSNGSAALKKANELLPDVVVLDVYMPGYSGLEVCKLLKENPQTAEIPILLTVGKLEPFKSDEALKAKANAFIVKPFEATELLAVIRKIEEATSKQERKPAKATPKAASPLAKAFAPTAVPEAPDAEQGIEEKGWKNRLSMPSKKKAEPEPEEEAPAMGTAFRDMQPEPAEESGLRRDSTFTADPVVAKTADEATEAPLDISPEEIAAIKAAVEVLSGQGDNAPVLHVPVAQAEGKPRQLAPEPEELPEAATAEKVSEVVEQGSGAVQVTAAVEAAAVKPVPAAQALVAASAESKSSEPSSRSNVTQWKAESVELTKGEAEASLEREMQEALATPAAMAETFNTYSLTNFAESKVAEPVDDEPIASEVVAKAVAAQAKVEAEPAPVMAVAASASGDSNATGSSAITTAVVEVSAAASPAVETRASGNESAGFQDLRTVVSAAAAPAIEASPSIAPDSASQGAPSADQKVDRSAPEDEIDSRTKSQMDAAWSNWRDIRNTIVTPKLTEQIAEVAAATTQVGVDEPATSEAEAQEASSIGNIVDSVLAEMRPRLMEEIARKMAAKKE
jgi:CheY-like chemotaxis protein